MQDLRNFLRDNHIKPPQLAEMLGVKRHAVNRWLSGLRRPGWESLKKLEKVTNGAVTADSFLPSSEGGE